MKQSRYLFKRNKTYYLRFFNRTTEVRLSLRTEDYYEACFLRDKILNSSSGSLMGKKNSFEIKNTELLGQRARSILESEIHKNECIFDLTDKQIKHYLTRDKIIKDQVFLERSLQKRIFILEKERLMNGGRLPDFIIDDLKLWANPEVLYSPIVQEEFKLFEKILISPSPIDNAAYKPKDIIELYITLKEAFFNISIEYLAKHYSLPVTPSNEEYYNQLAELGIFKKEDGNKQTKATPDICHRKLENETLTSSNTRTLRQVVDEYIDEKKVSNDVKQNTIEDATKMLALALEFLDENLDISEANNRPLLLSYKKALKAIPINRNKSRYKGKSIKELAVLKTNSPGMRTATTNKYLMYLTSLFKYAEERDYISKSQAYKLQDKNKVHPRDQNDRFSSDELVTLFTELKNLYGTGKKQEKFWIPLIALYSSCRLNEICQMNFGDVEKIQHIWFFRIRAEDDNNSSNKSLKTVYSQRNIPIHKTLINLGLIEYIQSRSLAPTDNLWDLKYEDIRNKYGRTVGRTFNELRKKLFNPAPRRKTFHSLRHTFSTFCRKITDNELVMYFDGHSSNNQTFGRYAKYDDYKWMKAEIDKLKYPPEVERMFKNWMKNT
jgi:integrase